MENLNSFCVHCHCTLVKGRHAFGMCSGCRAKYRYHNDKEYRKKWDAVQKKHRIEKAEKRKIISRISEWKIHGRNFESINQSCTYKGRFWEYYAYGILNSESAVIDVNKIKWGEHYDLLWKGKKIDVKSANRGDLSFWSFVTGEKTKADYFFCICLENDNPQKVYLIPKDKFNTGISIGRTKSKFDKYLVYPFFKLPNSI